MRLFPPQEKVTREANVRAAQSQDKHGDRLEVRKIETLAKRPPYISWPGAQQICRIERQRTLKGKTSLEFAGELLSKAGVVATPATGFGAAGEGYVRLTVCADEGRLAEAVRRLEAFAR